MLDYLIALIVASEIKGGDTLMQIFLAIFLTIVASIVLFLYVVEKKEEKEML